ncbi:toxin-antitoxin system [Nocardia sp. NPDC050713]|uniref:toxin-antitoxin system n=1 Tax=Nocardia sp. NPDC050713 TaxID=3154511 RepID=UPI0033D58DA9
MAQRPKGKRAQVGPRLALEVFEEVQKRAAANGMSISQYVADVMAIHVGRRDLVLELGTKQELPLAG